MRACFKVEQFFGACFNKVYIVDRFLQLCHNVLYIEKAYLFRGRTKPFVTPVFLIFTCCFRLSKAWEEEIKARVHCFRHFKWMTVITSITLCGMAETCWALSHPQHQQHVRKYGLIIQVHVLKKVIRPFKAHFLQSLFLVF